MEIKKEEIEKVSLLLKKIPFSITEKSNSVLFFPIEKTKKIKTESMLILEKKEDRGFKKFFQAGLIVKSENEKLKILLGYASTEYALKFDLMEFLEIKNQNLKEDIENLTTFSCFLIKNEHIQIEFNL